MTRKGRNKQCQEFTAGNQRRHRPPLPEWARENIILEGGRHTSLDLDGVPVDFCEYQNAPGGDFVKICCAGHERGVRAEYAWFGNKYPGAVLAGQRFTTLVVNGSPTKCDILTIELPDGTERNVCFDISAMMDDLHKKQKTSPHELFQAQASEKCSLSIQASLTRRYTMAYTKPVVLAQNGKQGSFAAGCPANNNGTHNGCKNCERTF